MRTTEFNMDIRTDIVYSRTKYDVIIYFWSEVIAKNCRKYRLRRLRVEILENCFLLLRIFLIRSFR